jgi:dipeptidyl aminopeptidase/acylaminoacyl peptidase
MRINMPRTLPFFFLVIALLANIAWSQQKRNLAIDDFFALRDVSDPQISPDGTSVAYVVKTNNLKEDKTFTDIYMSPFSGGEEIQLTSDEFDTTHPKSSPKPRWSPDGKYLAYLAKRDKKTNVFVLQREGGVETPLTNVKQNISDFDWSPDGKKMVLLMTDPDPDEQDEDKKDKKKTPKPIVVTRIQFKTEGTGYLNELRDHIYVFNIETKELKQLTSGAYDDSSPRWSPDGTQIVFVSNRTENADTNQNTDLFLISAAGGELKKLTTNPGPDSSPKWSPNGKWIAYLRGLHPEFIYYDITELALISATGGETLALTQKLDRNILRPKFSPDSKSIYFLLEDQTTMHLSNISIDGKKLDTSLSNEKVLSAFDVCENGIAYIASRSDFPAEVFALSKKGTQQVSHINTKAFADVEFGQMEPIRFKSKDGTPIDGFVIKPPHFDPSKKYPLVTWIHGGPSEQYQPDFDSYMIFRAQLLASNGYVVPLINYRGGTGYGLDFAKSIFADWGNKEVDDVLAGVDHVISQGYVDADRTGVGGWSYGGILTDAIITKTDRFKAAISGAGIANILAGYGTDEYQWYYETEIGFPWEKTDLWLKLSPFFKMDKIKTPTLFICAEKDWNVPLINSEQMYQGMRRLGIETMLIVYPNETSHIISTPSYVKDRFERYLAWYGHYLKGEPSKVPPPPKKEETKEIK